MARPLRIEYAGAVYHVTARGNAGQEVFVDDNDGDFFLDVLSRAADRFNWLCHAYCLMPNHYHLLVETVDPTLSRGMHYLNGVYAQRYNRRHERKGHLYQGRYKAILVQKDAHLLELVRYVALNPVRAGLAKRCEDWKWSSHRATAGLSPAPPFLVVDWVMAQFGGSPPRAIPAYQKFVAQGRGAAVWADLRGQIYLGTDTFIAKHGPQGSCSFREVPRVQRMVNRPRLRELFAAHGNAQAMTMAYRRYGYKLAEIGEFLGVHPATVSRRLRKWEGAGLPMLDRKT